MSKDLSIRPYILKFGMVYMVGVIILLAGFIILDLSHSAYASLIVLLGAVFFTASEFIQDFGRVPNKKEKSKLIWLSFLISWLVLLMLVFVAVLLLGGQQAMTEFGKMLSQVGAAKMIGAISVISMVYLLVLFLGYGQIAKFQYKIFRNKGMM